LTVYYADEDFPGPVHRTLVAAGVDIVRAQDFATGRQDEEVLAHATALGRVLLTRDLGFGERIVRDGLPARGVILVRLRGGGGWAARATRVLDALQAMGAGAEGAISTIDWTTVRSRALT
jgi:hypothetical protein